MRSLQLRVCWDVNEIVSGECVCHLHWKWAMLLLLRWPTRSLCDCVFITFPWAWLSPPLLRSLPHSLRFSISISPARLCLHLWIQSSFFSFGLRKFVLQCKSKSPILPLTTHTCTRAHTPHTHMQTKCMSLNKLWFIYTHFALFSALLCLTLLGSLWLCSLALGQSLSSHGKYSATKQLLQLCVCVCIWVCSCHLPVAFLQLCTFKFI